METEKKIKDFEVLHSFSVLNESFKYKSDYLSIINTIEEIEEVYVSNTIHINSVEKSVSYAVLREWVLDEQRRISLRKTKMDKQNATGSYYSARTRTQPVAITTTPPGYIAREFLQFVFSKKAFENIFSQSIADMREEHADALSKHQRKKARWILVRDHINLGLTVAVYVTSSIGKKILGIWKMIP